MLLRDVPTGWLTYFEESGDEANVGAAALLDAQTGETVSTGGQASLGAFRNGDVYGKGRDEREARDPGYGDRGGVSRFFYCAKTSSAERSAGLDGFPDAGLTSDGYGSIQTPILDRAAPRENWQPHPTKNAHPTVKPVDLMRWLCRLVCPPGGTILDPFTGSGTTGIAATLEGFGFVGCEREAEYHAIAEARIAWFAEHGEDAIERVRRIESAQRERDEHAARGQLDLLSEAAS